MKNFIKKIKRLITRRHIFTRKDIWRAYLDGRFDEIPPNKGNMDIAIYLDEEAKEYANSYKQNKRFDKPKE